MLTFDRSNSRQCVDVRINDDNDLEEDETFQVSLTTDDADVELMPNNGNVLIVDDDGENTGSMRRNYRVHTQPEQLQHFSCLMILSFFCF